MPSLSQRPHARLNALAPSSRKRKRRATRRLLSESLERRLLLTTITSVEPPENSHAAATSTDITATFDQDVVAGTATPQNFVVHGTASQGQLVGAAVSAAGPVITHNPANDFAAGELVQVTATASISATGGAANSRVWQFRTASSGSAQFVDGGAVFGTSLYQEVNLGDIDGDGDLDASLGASQIWTNDGTGGFTDSGQNLGGDIGGVDSEFADVDGDGDLDVVSAVRVALNNGSGVFTNTGLNLGGGSASVGDLDGDGDLDVMTGVAYAPNRIFFNNGSGQFTDSGQSMGNGSTDGISFGDLDGDGDLDAFERLAGTPNKVWTNNGSGVFSDTGQTLGTYRATKDGDLGDVDGDGDLDVVVGNAYNTAVHLYINDGGGLFFEAPQPLVTANSPFVYGVNLADLDGDGDLDLTSFDRLTPNQIWLNDGLGTFIDTGQRLTYPGKIQNWSSTIGDLDGDGDLDLVEVNRTAGASSRVWFNQNLTPNVTLSVDNAVIPEAAGTATVTATLSAAHTDPVTVSLGISGTATATDDYTASDTEIVIAAGAMTGSVTITAVQDTADEPDETVVVAITAVTNGQEMGTQQITTTIVDDDESVPVPDVTLSVDNATISEAGGVATFTANLSVVTTVPVTIDLGISGTAAAADYAATGTQIVIAPGATSGSITVTAVQDETDEPDETVIVDVISIAGGAEAGVQQQTTTIADDDEPPMPDVALSVDTTEIAEAAGVATLTLTLSEVTTVPVTVALTLSGTAAATDYAASATEVVIAAGATTGSLTVTAVQDEVNESDETVIVDITTVTGGNEDGVQQQTITIVDDDVPPSFAVTSLEATASGFRVEFANELDGSELNLVDTQNAGLGAADVVVTGAAGGAVNGSLLIDSSAVTFIKSGGPLAADTYTVTLRSATDGFKDAAAMLLDGNGDGTGGDDYASSFTIEEAPAGARTVSVPDFVRGSGQEVNLPANERTGIPITISDGENVRAVDVRIGYDPALLEITGATAPAGGSVIVNTTTTPGVAILVFFSSAALPAGSSTFINLQATVPEGASYGSQQLLDLHAVTIGDGNDNEFPVVVDDATHFSTYFADVSGNGRINASDAAQVARFAALIDAGFAASLNTDPIVVGDISGNGRINAADASRVAQFAALIDVPEIPPVPGTIQIAGIRLAEPSDTSTSLATTRNLGTLPVAPGLLTTASATRRLESDSTSFDIVPNFSTDPRRANDLNVDRALTQLMDSTIDDVDEEDLALALEDTLNEVLSAVD